uniref:hypothetical protein n=1 Tax=Flavobacterium sp. TaxID=239 RepID=UPI00404A8ADC
MKKVLFITLLLILSKSYSQTKYDIFDELIVKADSLKKIENYKLALKKYNEALKVLTPNSSTPFFDAAVSSIKLNNKRNAKKWIIDGIVKGGAKLDYLKNYEGFRTIQTEKYYLEILENYNKYRQIYFSNLKNIDIYFEIKELVNRDQFCRKLEDYFTNRSEIEFSLAFNNLIKAQNENDTLLIKKYQKILYPKIDEDRDIIYNTIMKNVDKLNIERLMEITKLYGWQESAWLILWHQRGNHDEDNYVWNFFRPIINKEIEEGKLSRSFWKPFDNYKKEIEASKK